jgi:hypothetical protein
MLWESVACTRHARTFGLDASSCGPPDGHHASTNDARGTFEIHKKQLDTIQLELISQMKWKPHSSAIVRGCILRVDCGFQWNIAMYNWTESRAIEACRR